jgi:hypothetical protein
MSSLQSLLLASALYDDLDELDMDTLQGALEDLSQDYIAFPPTLQVEEDPPCGSPQRASPPHECANEVEVSIATHDSQQCAVQATCTRDRALPPPPSHHPTRGWLNHYDPSAPWDYSMTAEVVSIIDRFDDPPHRAYLVHWQGKPFQMSWVWPEDLEGLEDLMDRVDNWKQSGSTESFARFNARTYSRLGASDTGLCFLEACQAALFFLGRPELVTTTLWKQFEAQHDQVSSEGVTKSDVTKFFKFARSERIPLDYDLLFRSCLKGSINSVQDLSIHASTLQPGCFIVGAECDKSLQHCFVLIVSEDRVACVVDGYDSSDDPPCIQEPLLHLQWVRKVIFMRQVKLQEDVKVHGKRKTKTQRQREKRARTEA